MPLGGLLTSHSSFEARQKQWQVLWKQSPLRTPFSHIAYAKALHKATGVSFRIEGGTLNNAGLLLFYRRRGPFTEALVPPFTAYTSLLLSSLPSEADSTQKSTPLLELLTSTHSLAYSALHVPPALSDSRPFRWAGWQITPFYTYHLALNNQAALLNRWSSSQRRLYRKHATDYAVEERTDAGSTIASLCYASYTRQQRSFPLRESQLHHLIQLTHAAGLARMFTARHKASGVCEGGLALLVDDQTAYYWIVGSQPGPAMTILLGTVLPLLYHDGLQSFDFLGANTPSIAEFKRRFGPTLVPYYRLERYGSKMYRMLHTIRRNL